MELLEKLYRWGPVFFGIGFLAPLIAQGMTALDLDAPFGLSQIQFGLLVGTGWGLIAKVGGRWI